MRDKQKAISEYVRVIKSGGYVGLNEATWIKIPPPKELVEYLSCTYGIKEILTPDGWKELLVNAGLRDICLRTYKANILSERLEALKDFLRVWHKVAYLYIKSSAFRRFVKEGLTIPKGFLEYWGYGIYVGRK
jgi:ubiquinone/menaquinone biosynthesis C-methylase UbiE